MLEVIAQKFRYKQKIQTLEDTNPPIITDCFFASLHGRLKLNDFILKTKIQIQTRKCKLFWIKEMTTIRCFVFSPKVPPIIGVFCWVRWVWPENLALWISYYIKMAFLKMVSSITSSILLIFADSNVKRCFSDGKPTFYILLFPNPPFFPNSPWKMIIWNRLILFDDLGNIVWRFSCAEPM